jgi:hypothetical protein
MLLVGHRKEELRLGGLPYLLNVEAGDSGQTIAPGRHGTLGMQVVMTIINTRPQLIEQFEWRPENALSVTSFTVIYRCTKCSGSSQPSGNRFACHQAVQLMRHLASLSVNSAVQL